MTVAGTSDATARWLEGPLGFAGVVPRGPLVLRDDDLERSGDRHRPQDCDEAAEEPARDAYQRTAVTVTEKSRLGGRHSG